ncbi:MAG TPA: adenine deaminase [Candidatus Aphodomonas merdavium]|nr:adenine deaminase [Candidatus Aphodomonas merdavium]
MKHNRILSVALGDERADLVLKNAQYLNVFTCEFLRGDIAVTGGRIAGIGSYRGKEEVDCTGKTVVPGLIDGHIHLESSLISPAQFARAAVAHGTTALVTDPHEIANVCGESGIQYMLRATRSLPLDVYFMVSSCVPCSPFDENGCTLGVETIRSFLTQERVLGLAEMMNYPGVVAGDREALEKIECALAQGGVVDGHAPTLSGKQLNAYVACGISSDHETTTLAEALEKLRLGQWIMIREGTAAKNLRALLPLLEENTFRRCLFCCDDIHPGELMAQGHIDRIVRSAIAQGVKPERAYCCASYHAALRFGLAGIGAIAPGYAADLTLLDDVSKAEVAAVYKRGRLVAQGGALTVPLEEETLANRKAVLGTVRLKDFSVQSLDTHGRPLPVIGLVPHQLVTTKEGTASAAGDGLLKLAVIERHKATGHIGICYLKGYGLRSGAVATTVAHDSHNIIVTGTNDGDMARAVLRLQETGGGMVLADHGEIVCELPLPLAGLMCDLDAETAQQRLTDLKQAAYALGVSDGVDPFMTLSFMSLPVIPHIKLTTLGAVDVDAFRLLP